jgi:predicted phosphoribosyltransferase
MLFNDRQDAGRQLAALLAKFRSRSGVVYALPRGGVPVAAEVARLLQWPLDLVTARKVGHPYQQEYAIAAVTETGEIATNPDEVGRVDRQWFERAVAAERQEAQRRHTLYLGRRTAPSVMGKVAIVVDDGIATGLTMKAAIMQLRRLRPEYLVLAIPVAPHDTAQALSHLVDEIVAVDIPYRFLGAVGSYYRDFHQVSDDEVIATLTKFGAPTEK